MLAPAFDALNFESIPEPGRFDALAKIKPCRDTGFEGNVIHPNPFQRQAKRVAVDTQNAEHAERPVPGSIDFD